MGVEDWIFFEVEKEADLGVLERIREQVKQVLVHWIHSDSSHTQGHRHARSSQSSSASSAKFKNRIKLLDTLCWAFQQKTTSRAEEKASNR